tara:strand:- start:2493 stop:3698 length:1206 start_codon:yes stop_codon:yes gene_type:complete
MALPNLSGSNIQDTFQRVIHTDGVSLTDGTGSALSIVNATTGSFNHIITDGDTIEFRNAASQAVEGNLVFSTTEGLQVKNANKTDTAKIKVKDLSADKAVINTSVTVTGPISSSGTVHALSITASQDMSVREITASGNITCSGNITAGKFLLEDDSAGVGVKNLSIYHPTSNAIRIGHSVTNDTGLFFMGHVTTSGNISASGNINFLSDSINETTASSHYTHIVQDNDGMLKSDTKVKVLKVTGARMKTIGSSPLTVFAAPGANKAIHIDQIVLFVDYAAPTANFPAFQTGGVERNKLTFICIPDDGQSSNQVVPMGAFNRAVINASKDTIVAKHIPVSQMRLGLNKPIFLRNRRSNLNTNNSAGDSTNTPGSDYYFKIKYRVIDITTDFGPSFTDGTITP